MRVDNFLQLAGGQVELVEGLAGGGREENKPSGKDMEGRWGGGDVTLREWKVICLKELSEIDESVEGKRVGVREVRRTNKKKERKK